MQLFQDLERKHGLPSGLLDAVWSAESGRGKQMLSPAGAKGHFQFMDPTAKQYGVSNPGDLAQAATGAARMFSDLLRQTGGDLAKSLAGYNWGIGNVTRKGLDQAPAETRNYIQKVSASMGQPQQQQADPWAALAQKYKQPAGSQGDGVQPRDDPWAALADKYRQSVPDVAVRQEPNPAQPQQQVAAPAQPQRSTLDNIGRQFGLTGRYALEGAGQAADLVAAPLNALMRMGGIKATNPSQTAGKAADWLGLPSPQTTQERWVGDAARLGFGAAAPAGIAAKLAPMALSTLGRAVTAGLAENPAAQIGGGAGSGAASGGVREAGGTEFAQMGAGLLGGVTGGMAGNAAMRTTSRAAEPLARAVGADPVPQVQVLAKMSDEQLSAALRTRLDIPLPSWSAMSRHAQSSLLADVRKANNLDNLDYKSLRRLADMRALEITPTRGTITLDPIQITREKNLAKAGANSAQRGLQGLAKTENQNNAQLVKLLQGVEGGREVDSVEAGRALVGSVLGRSAALRGAEKSAWTEAKASPGYKMPMQARVLSDINAALDEEAMMPFMDRNISAYMQDLQRNPGKFTPQAYRNLQSQLSKAMNAGGNEAAAAGIARRVLEGAEMRPAATQIHNPGNLPVTEQMAKILRSTDPMPGNAMAAIDEARRATRSAYAFEDSSPLVRKVLSDGSMSDPSRIGRHILSATPDEAQEIARHLDPQGLQTARNAIATQIKKSALGKANDEVGNVSQKALNSAIDAMGKEKLGIFFTPEEVQQLERIGRVASYLQVQPSGAAVNNSNSGATIIGKVTDALAGLLKLPTKLPALGISQTVDATSNWFGNHGAQQVHKGLLRRDPSYTPGLLNYPIGDSSRRGLAVGGLLALPENTEERENAHRK